MPSSVNVGSRPPSRDLIRSYSSEVSPWSRRTSDVMARVAVDIWGKSIVAFSGEIQKHLAADSNSKAFNRRDRGALAERTRRKTKYPQRFRGTHWLGDG